MRSIPLLSLVLILAQSKAEKCLHPRPAPGYQDDLYAGRWYEVGKYQTAGGAFFQQGTVCTIATYNPYKEPQRGGAIGYSSRRTTPVGSWANATGVLEPLETPGHFSQTLEFFEFQSAPVDYNVVWLDEDTAIEYDCSEHLLGLLDYCVHFMSRTPTISQEKLELMMEFVSDVGLNPHNLEYMEGSQHGCWG